MLKVETEGQGERWRQKKSQNKWKETWFSASHLREATQNISISTYVLKQDEGTRPAADSLPRIRTAPNNKNSYLFCIGFSNPISSSCDH